MSIESCSCHRTEAASAAGGLAMRPATAVRCLSCVVLVLAAMTLASPAAASPQADTIVRCDPSTAVGDTDHDLVVDLYVESVTNLNAVDLEITFNKDVALVVDQDGSTDGVQMQPLSPPVGLLYPDFVIFNVADNLAGTAHYAATQMAKPAADGSGPVVRLTFQPSTYGDLNIVFTRHQLSTPQGTPVPHILGTCSIRFQSPLAVALSDFVVLPQRNSVLVAWESESEVQNLGFNLYRRLEPDGERERLNDKLIPSQAIGSSGGASYEYLDQEVATGKTYSYWLETVASSGRVQQHGPVRVTVPARSLRHHLPLMVMRR